MNLYGDIVRTSLKTDGWKHFGNELIFEITTFYLHEKSKPRPQ